MRETSLLAGNDAPKLASMLTLVACALTIFAAIIVFVGLGPALLFAAINIVAFAAWFMTVGTHKDTDLVSSRLTLWCPLFYWL